MYIEIGILAAGVAPGYLLRKNEAAHKWSGRLIMWTIYALLFCLGARLGGDAQLFSQLDRLGFSALLFAFCCTLGSAVAVRLAQRFFREKGAARLEGGPLESGPGEAGTGEAGPSETDPGETDSDEANPDKGRAPSGARKLAEAMRGSLIILAFFLGGMLLGRLDWLPSALYHGRLTTWMLWAMLFAVGGGIGFDLSALRIVRDMGLRVLLIPLLTVAGSLAGALLACLFLPGTGAAASLVVGSTVSYYSLGSVLVTELGNPALGSVVLLANLFRELFSLFSTPLLARLLGPLAPGAAAGAAAMDTCLPVIMQSCGERYAILAIFNGLAMTIFVPFAVPFAMGFV